MQVEVCKELLLKKPSLDDTVQLGCFIAHLDFVGGDKLSLDRAEALRKVLLNPVHYLEKTFDATPDGMWYCFVCRAIARVMLLL